MESNDKNYHPIATLVRTTSETKQAVLSLYAQGKSQLFIEQKLHMTRKTIRTILKEAGVDRTKSAQWMLRHGNSLNQNAFDVLTPEALYWIGFLYADGHVTSTGNGVEVGVHTQDKEHLQKFLDFVGSTKKATKDPRGEYWRVRFGSDKIHVRLRELGFTSDKSKVATPHVTCQNSRDFWRGVVDGDGCLHWLANEKSPSISLCGTKSTIDGFISFVVSSGVSTRVRAFNPKTYSRVLWNVMFTATKARAIAKVLYQDSGLYLERKFQKYQEHFQ